MPSCSFCGIEVLMPYVCTYCQNRHCADHRLPESHGCINLAMAKAPTTAANVRWSVQSEGAQTGVTVWWRRFSGSEIRQILAAWLALSFAFSVRYLFIDPGPLGYPVMFGLLLIIVGLAFVGHEMAHKFLAQRYNCWAEFRAWNWGLIMAVMMSLVFAGTFVFAAPGAVYITPRSWTGISRRENGIISVAGPLMNVLFAAIFFLSLLFNLATGMGGPVLFVLANIGFSVNLLLGAFNLIPFGLFDGQKVLAWRPLWWAIVALPLWALSAFLFLF